MHPVIFRLVIAPFIAGARFGNVMWYCLLIPMILVIFSIAPCHADQPRAWSARGVTGLPESVKIKLAESAEPFWYIPETDGMSLREIVKSACGIQGPLTDIFLASKARELNHAPSLEWKVEADTAIAIPFCLKVENNVPVTIQSGDTVETILREHYGVYGSKTVTATYRLNQDDYRDVESFARDLKPGKTLIIPHASNERIYKSNSYSSVEPQSLPEVVESLDYTTLRAPMMENMTEVESPPEDKIKYDYVRFVTIPTVDGVEKCKLGEGEVRAPTFDSADLLTRLSAEAIAIGKTVEQLDPGVVGLIDSGVTDLGVTERDDFFPKDFLLANQREKDGGINHVDDDDPENGKIDDVYGINFNTDNGRIAFYPTDRSNRDHGTKIASLVLGGREFLESRTEAERSLIQLKIVNFSSSRIGESTVAAFFLGPAIAYLDEQDVNVINMSLLSGKRIAGVSNTIEEARDILFVVAAGNSEEGLGRDVTHTTVFPARHGGSYGDHKRQVITVGAHDRYGGWARFSHYSTKFVDLLAPGCAVEVRGIRGIETPSPPSFEFENGTSVATAQVSFAAALLSALEEKNPQNKKNRLLAGTDFDPLLDERAWTSGRLNVVKAISLSHDVIDFVSDRKPYSFGKIANPTRLRSFCGDESKRTNQLHNLVKVLPNLGHEGAFIEYWTKNDSLLSRVRCPQIRSGESIGEFEVDGVVRPGPILSTIRDIVFASRR